MRYETISFEDVEAETAKAFCFTINKIEVWIPKSVLGDGSEDLEVGCGPGDVEVATWFCEKEGIG